MKSLGFSPRGTGSNEKEAGESADKIYVFRRPFPMRQMRCIWATVDRGHHFAAEEGDEERWTYVGGYEVDWICWWDKCGGEGEERHEGNL